MILLIPAFLVCNSVIPLTMITLIPAFLVCYSVKLRWMITLIPAFMECNSVLLFSTLKDTLGPQYFKITGPYFTFYRVDLK